MRWKDYVIASGNTCAELDNQELNDKHMLLGVMTELGELADAYKKQMAYKKPLDSVNVLEEVGDTAWYLANLCRMHDLYMIFSWSELHNMSNTLGDDPINLILYAQGKLTLLIMYAQGEGDIAPEDMLRAIVDIITTLHRICRLHSSVLAVVLETNIAKLKRRYPDKFNEEDAINRDTKAERDILEGT